MTDPHPWLSSYPGHVPWQTTFTGRPVSALLDDSVAAFPSHTCLDFLGRTYTYAQLGGLVERAAAGFRALGVDKGVKVGLFLPNCPQFVIAFFGILRAGGTVVNYSPLCAEADLVRQIEDSGTTIMVTLNLKVLYSKMDPVLEQGRIQKLVVGTLQEALPFPKNLLFSLVRRGETAPVADDGRRIPFPPPDRAADSLPEGGHRPRCRRGRPPVHRRYHGHLERRNADPRQSLHQRAAGDSVEPGA